MNSLEVSMDPESPVTDHMEGDFLACSSIFKYRDGSQVPSCYFILRKAALPILINKDYTSLL
jgi:hypothetical protein